MEAARAFIVRPFGTQDGIDFDRVEKDLIAPALELAGIEGRTTLEITRQGNIREDMFRLLVLSDLMIPTSPSITPTCSTSSVSGTVYAIGTPC
jgi:hypothetical protein